MTAFGRANIHSEIGDFVVEIQSVNRKHLDISIDLPKELSCFEMDLKKWLQPHVSRGNVHLKVSVSYENTSPIIVHPNIPLARQIKHAWDLIAKDLKIEEDFKLSLLVDIEGILLFEENVQEEERYSQALKQVLNLALEKFLHMKVQEGNVLQSDILARMQKIYQWIKWIEERAPTATRKYRDKLISRLEELLPGSVENEERILREVAVFAEKIDIAEEITRFFCHMSYLGELIHSDTTNVGKTLEFVIQELNREINTIGSKSSDLEIARFVIDIKSELERIREQIQNVE